MYRSTVIADWLINQCKVRSSNQPNHSFAGQHSPFHVPRGNLRRCLPSRSDQDHQLVLPPEVCAQVLHDVILIFSSSNTTPLRCAPSAEHCHVPCRPSVAENLSLAWIARARGDREAPASVCLIAHSSCVRCAVIRWRAVQGPSHRRARRGLPRRRLPRRR